MAQEYGGAHLSQHPPAPLHAGADKLNVDAVLLIGEHGDYPWNERGRHMYPRRYFFEQIAGVFAESGRSVPVFSDKAISRMTLEMLSGCGIEQKNWPSR